MEKADLPAVLAIERAVFPEDAWTEEMLEGELAAQGDVTCYLVAVDGPDVVGYAGLFAPGGGQGDVQTIAVAADRQGEGIGRKLLYALIAEAEARGCREVLLDVRAGNAVARRLYRRTGFTDVGVRRGYYQPSGADAIVMRLKLPRGGDGQPWQEQPWQEQPWQEQPSQEQPSQEQPWQGEPWRGAPWRGDPSPGQPGAGWGGQDD